MMRMIREAKEIQDKIEELLFKLENMEKIVDNEWDIVQICGWLQALIWVCNCDDIVDKGAIEELASNQRIKP